MKVLDFTKKKSKLLDKLIKLGFHDFLGRVPRPLWSWVNAFPFH